MAAEIRDEFENYVKRLTTAICQDILLERMEELCAKYEEEYQKYSKVTKTAAAANAMLQKEVQAADKSIKSVETQLQKALGEMARDIDAMEEDTRALFEEMKALNGQSRSDFITELSSYIDRYKLEVAGVFDEGCGKISDKLSGVITPQVLQGFLDSLEAYTRETKALASFVNDAYRDEVEAGFKAITEKNKAALDEIREGVNACVSKALADIEEAKQDTEGALGKKAQAFLNVTNKLTGAMMERLDAFQRKEEESRDEALARQAELIGQIGPSDEKMAQLEDHVASLEKMVSDMKWENAVNGRKMQELIQKRQEVLSEKKEENLSWKMYMVFSNTLIWCLFLLLVFLQKPWEVFGVQFTCIASAVFLAFVIVGAEMRKVLARAVVKLGQGKHRRESLKEGQEETERFREPETAKADGGRPEVLESRRGRDVRKQKSGEP